MRRPNDVGGLPPAGPIVTRGHEPEPWERLLTALVSTVGPTKAKINCITNSAARGKIWSLISTTR